MLFHFRGMLKIACVSSIDHENPGNVIFVLLTIYHSSFCKSLNSRNFHKYVHKENVIQLRDTFVNLVTIID